MFRKNLAFIFELADSGAPLAQILSAFVETFLAIEDHIEIHGGPEIASREYERFRSSILTIADGVAGLNEEFQLQLDGNLGFLRTAVRNEDPPDGVLFFLARTLDAVRTPIDLLPAEREERASQEIEAGVRRMLGGLHELEALF